MSAPRAVVLVLEMGVRPREVIRLGVEFARTLDLRANAVFVEPPTTLEACGLLGPRGAELRPGALELVVDRERTRVRADFEAEARRARVGHGFEAVRDETERVLEGATSPGDIAVLSVDLSDRRFDRPLSIAERLRARRVGALFVPETAVARRGDIVALDAAVHADAAVARLARSFSTRMIVAPLKEAVDREPTRSDAPASTELGVAAPLMLVLASRHAAQAQLTAAFEELRRHRAALLLLAEIVSPRQ